MAKKKSKKTRFNKKTFSFVLAVIVVILLVAWFVCGKPVVEIGAEGITIIQTEEPLIFPEQSAVPEPVEGLSLIQPHNIRLIFTDGEELGEQGGVQQQGAFALAQLFKKLGITNDDIYVFDCMGRGDVPILGAAKLPPNVPTRFLTAYSELEDRAKQILK